MGVVKTVLHGTLVAQTWGAERRKPSPNGYDALIEYLEDTLDLDDDDFSSMDYAFKRIDEALGGRGVEMTDAFSAALNNRKVVPSIVDEANEVFLKEAKSSIDGLDKPVRFEDFFILSEDKTEEERFRDYDKAKTYAEGSLRKKAEASLRSIRTLKGLTNLRISLERSAESHGYGVGDLISQVSNKESEVRLKERPESFFRIQIRDATNSGEVDAIIRTASDSNLSDESLGRLREVAEVRKEEL